jgi:hypothetical protein
LQVQTWSNVNIVLFIIDIANILGIKVYLYKHCICSQLVNAKHHCRIYSSAATLRNGQHNYSLYISKKKNMNEIHWRLTWVSIIKATPITITLNTCT